MEFINYRGEIINQRSNEIFVTKAVKYLKNREIKRNYTVAQEAISNLLLNTVRVIAEIVQFL